MRRVEVARSTLRRALPAAAIALAACGGAGPVHEDDAGQPAQWQEAPVSLPPAPRAEDLIEFLVGRRQATRFFVDSRSLAVGRDGTVSFASVIESAGGARTVAYEALRCATGERKLHAVADAAGQWMPTRNPDWHAITPSGPSAYRMVLMREYFCPDGYPIASAPEGVDALRRGGHPRTRPAGGS